MPAAIQQVEALVMDYPFERQALSRDAGRRCATPQTRSACPRSSLTATRSTSRARLRAAAGWPGAVNWQVVIYAQQGRPPGGDRGALAGAVLCDGGRQGAHPRRAASGSIPDRFVTGGAGDCRATTRARPIQLRAATAGHHHRPDRRSACAGTLPDFARHLAHRAGGRRFS